MAVIIKKYLQSTKLFLKSVNRILSYPDPRLIRKIERSTNAKTWVGAEKTLFEYNKSIITLASSALVLSFTAIKIGDISPDKMLIGISWFLFILTIFLGVLNQFTSFLYQLTKGKIDSLIEEGKTLKYILDQENDWVLFFWQGRSFMIWISFIELLLFSVALAVMILAAFYTL